MTEELWVSFLLVSFLEAAIGHFGKQDDGLDGPLA